MSTVIVESLTSPTGRVVSTEQIAIRNPMLSSQLPTLTAVGEYAFLTDYGQNAWFRGNGAWSTNEKYTAADQILDYDFMTHQYKKMESYGIVPTTLASAVTVSRSGTALYSSVYDGLESASANTARIEYTHQTGISGLMCEPAATNSILQSNNFAHASWTKVGIIESSTSTVLAPDNVSNSTLLREDVSNGGHYAWQSVATTNSQVYGFSVYAKPAASDYVVLEFLEHPTFTRTVHAFFDVRAGIVLKGPFVTGGASQGGASIEKAANGWYRISVWCLLGGANSNIQARVRLSDSINNDYAGDGNRSVYLWGAQLEQKGQGVTTLIQTTTAALGRSEDVVYQDVPYMNPEQGTIFADFTLESYDFATSGQAVLFKLIDSSNQIHRGFAITIDAGNLVCRIRDTGVSSSNSSNFAVKLASRYRVAVSYAVISSTTTRIGISVNGMAPIYFNAPNRLDGFTGRLYLNGGSAMEGTATFHSKIVHRVRAFTRALSEYEMRLLSA